MERHLEKAVDAGKEAMYTQASFLLHTNCLACTKYGLVSTDTKDSSDCLTQTTPRAINHMPSNTHFSYITPSHPRTPPV